MMDQGEDIVVGIGSELHSNGRYFNVCEILYNRQKRKAFLVAIGSEKKSCGLDVFVEGQQIGKITNDGPAKSLPTLDSNISSPTADPSIWDPFTIVEIDHDFEGIRDDSSTDTMRADDNDFMDLCKLLQTVYLEQIDPNSGSPKVVIGKISAENLTVRLEGWNDCGDIKVDTFEVEFNSEEEPKYFRPGQRVMADGLVIGYSLAKFDEDVSHYAVFVPRLTDVALEEPWGFMSASILKLKRRTGHEDEEIGVEQGDTENFDLCVDQLLSDFYRDEKAVESVEGTEERVSKFEEKRSAA